MFAEIARELEIAKSTAYSWTHGLHLSQGEKNRSEARLRVAQQAKVTHLAALNKQRHKERDDLLGESARKIVEHAPLSLDHKKLLCSVLFWCEGGKDVRGGIQFINSDPAMIQKFLSLLREGFPIQENKFRALIHLHEYHNQEKQLRFWSKVTEIPISQFHKPYLKPNTGKNTRIGYPGCVSIRYLDSALGKLLKMIYSEFGKST